MGRSTIIGLVVIIVVILIAVFAFGPFRSGADSTGTQPSPHAIDQSP